jgi:hypothetical protein
LRRRSVRAMRRLARLSERRKRRVGGSPPAEEPWEALGSVPESRAKPASTRDFEQPHTLQANAACTMKPLAFLDPRSE